MHGLAIGRRSHFLAQAGAGGDFRSTALARVDGDRTTACDSRVRARAIDRRRHRFLHLDAALGDQQRVDLLILGLLANDDLEPLGEEHL